MTLSHHWPSQKEDLSPLLTKEGRIVISSLPRIFQDAIYVTRYFSVRWLWIDSLCIQQNSRRDLLVQIGLMHNVYGNSFCNISATGALDNRESLFSDRDHNADAQLKVDLSAWVDVHKVGLGQDDIDRSPRYLLKPIWQHCVADAFLNRRGWVIQERYLAPRLLHFAKGQLFWECRRLSACELFPAGLPSSLQYRGLPFKLQDYSGVGAVDRASRLRITKSWWVIVENYSAAELSNPEDKFAAIAGLASRFAQILNDEYLAGLWRSSLVSDLLWVSTGAARETKTHRVPTWSWASLDGGDIHGFPLLNKIDDETVTLCDVVQAEVATHQESRSEVVTGGTLRLTCRLFRFPEKRSPSGGANTLYLDGAGHHECYVNLDDKRFADAGPDDGRKVQGAWGALMLRQSYHDATTRYDGLILRAIEPQQGIFSRLGTWRVISLRAGLDFLHCLIEDPSAYPFPEFNPHTGYTIAIV